MRRAAPLAGVLVLLAVWHLAARSLDARFLLAGPEEVAGWLWSHPGLIGRALADTLGNAAWGFALGNAAAMLIAAAAVLWPPLFPLLAGLALVVFCLPLVATGPLLRVMMGPGDGPQIALAALAVYYTTLIPLLAGARAVPSSWFDLIRVYGRGRWSQLTHVRARAALPYLLAGLQIAAPAAFLGAMVGEFTGAERGMGVLTIRFLRAMDLPALWAVAILGVAVAMAVYAAVGALGRWLIPEAPPVILSPPRLARGGPGRRLAALAGLVAAVLVLWWGGMALLGLNPFFAKRPPDLIAALTTAPEAAAIRLRLLEAMAETAVLALPGYAAGLAVGAGLAILLQMLPWLGGLLTPLAVALRSIPIVTTAPLIVLLLGRGATGTITLVAVMVFFGTFVACAQGLRQAPGPILDLFRSYAAGPWRQLVSVRIPAMLPALFASARMSVPAAVLAVTVVEWLATGRGLGHLMTLSASLSDYTMLWLTVVAVTAMSALLYGAVAMVERQVLLRFAPEQVDR